MDSSISMMIDAILNGTHRVSQEKAIMLAGIQCQVQFGDHNEQIHKPGLFENKDFLPIEYCKIKGIEKKIFLEHKKWAGYRERDAKMKYTQQCLALKTYGITFFFVKEKIKGKSRLVPRLFGINNESVVCANEKTKEIMKTWPLTTIKRWAASLDSFTLDFGDHSDQYYSVQTQEGEQIAALVASYIDILIREKKDKAAKESLQDEVAPSTPGTANVAELNDSITQKETNARDHKAANADKKLYSSPSRGSRTPPIRDPAMKTLFEQIGIVDESQVDDDTLDFMYDFVDEHGGLNAVSDVIDRRKPPPAPSHHIPQPTWGEPPPPPPNRGGRLPPPPGTGGHLPPPKGAGDRPPPPPGKDGRLPQPPGAGGSPPSPPGTGGRPLPPPGAGGRPPSPPGTGGRLPTAPVRSDVSAPPRPSIPHSKPQGSPPPLNRGIVTVDLPDPQTSSDCQDSIVTVARGRDNNREINASSQESEILDSDIYGSITTTKPDVMGLADSDMCGSIIKKTVGQESSYSSDEEDDVQNDTFAIILRCKRRRGGYSRSFQNAGSRDEALTWRYMFKNDTKLQEFKQKIGTVCDLIEISIDSNVADIECENAKPTVIEENVKKFVSFGTTDLRVKAFNIKMEESRKVVNVLKTTRTDFSDKTVSVFIESTVCYLVCPAHVFENNMVAFQKTHEYISALPSN